MGKAGLDDEARRITRAHGFWLVCDVRVFEQLDRSEWSQYHWIYRERAHSHLGLLADGKISQTGRRISRTRLNSSASQYFCRTGTVRHVYPAHCAHYYVLKHCICGVFERGI